MRCILRLFHAFALGLLFVVSGAREAGAITYHVDRTLGSAGRVTGTITTDDTIGVLAASNIVDWDLYTEDGVFSLSQRGPLNAADLGIDPSLWGVFVRGSAFSATSTDLFFSFGSELNDLVLFQTTPLGSGKEYYCLAANTTACITAATESLQIPDYTPASHQFEARSGGISIGTVEVDQRNGVFADSFETDAP